MKKSVYTILALFMLFSTQAQNKKTLKKGVIQDVENQKKELIEISDTIWEAAEIAFQETVSSETLIAYAKANGFDVEVGVAESGGGVVGGVEQALGLGGGDDGRRGVFGSCVHACSLSNIQQLRQIFIFR